MKLVRKLLVLLLAFCASTAWAQESREDSAGVHIDAEQFQAGWLHRFIFGDLWRDAWTASNAISSFRPSIVPSLLPRRLESVVSPSVRDDLAAAYHPYAARIAEPLLIATGVGAFPENRPSGCPDTIDTPQLLQRVCADAADQIDARSYLTLRLSDWFLGNEVEDVAGWRWVADTSRGLRTWTPISHDFSRAFARLDGVFGVVMPIFLGNLPDIERRTYSGESSGPLAQLDRRILPVLTGSVWDSVSAQLVTLLSDSVIKVALDALPAKRGEQHTPDLEECLRGRRDALMDVARCWYEEISETVDLYASEMDDQVEVTSNDDGGSQVTVWPKGDLQSNGRNRHFEEDITSEIRIHLLGGDDKLVLRGKVGGGTRIVILGGAGHDEIYDGRGVDDRATVRVYDDRSTRLSGSSAMSLELPPPRTGGVQDSELSASREDRGTRVGREFLFDVNSQVGVLFGIGPVWTSHGLFDDPYAYRVSVVAGYSPFMNNGKVVVESDFRSLLQGTSIFVRARASGVEQVRYFGFGNEGDLARKASDDFYRVNQTQYSAEMGMRIPASGAQSIAASGVLTYTKTRLDGVRLIDREKPFGVGDILECAAKGKVLVDTRDYQFLPSEGMLVQATYEYHPRLLDLESAFSKAQADAQVYLSGRVPIEWTLGVRLHGERVWGLYPYYSAALLGGAGSLRGYYDGRFEGDASFLAGTEMRVPLGSLQVVIPARWGVMGFIETGQSYSHGVTSHVWHPSYGGGIWVVPALRELSVSVFVGNSVESTIVYFEAALGM